MTQKSSFIDTF